MNKCNESNNIYFTNHLFYAKYRKSVIYYDLCIFVLQNYVLIKTYYILRLLLCFRS